MSNWARPGVKCVCMAAGWPRAVEMGLTAPEFMAVYEVRAVAARRIDDAGTFVVGLYLVEIVNGPIHADDGTFEEPCWAIEWFRPLVTRTQEEDVALFAPLLHVATEPVT